MTEAEMMTPRNKKVMKLLEWCRANMCTPDGKRVCLLCKHEPVAGEQAAIGLFFADKKHQKRLGAPHGMDRIIIYLLCDDCMDVPDRNERVEDKIFAAVNVQ